MSLLAARMLKSVMSRIENATFVCLFVFAVENNSQQSTKFEKTIETAYTSMLNVPTL